MGVITERERQKYFAYLDGVADGLTESRNDINSVLEDIKAEIEKKCEAFEKCNAYECANGLNWALKVIDKHMAEGSNYGHSMER